MSRSDKSFPTAVAGGKSSLTINGVFIPIGSTLATRRTLATLGETSLRIRSAVTSSTRMVACNCLVMLSKRAAKLTTGPKTVTLT